MTLYPDCKGLNARLIITVDIKVPGYNSYSLDALIDTWSTCSCAWFGAILECYSKPIQTYFPTINKTKIPIKGFAPDFPLFFNVIKTFVNLYKYDIGSDIFLGHGFVNKYFPMTIGTNQVTFIVQGKNITIPNKESYENKVQDKIANVDELELSIEKLARLKKIVRHANLHGLEIIHYIK